MEDLIDQILDIEYRMFMSVNAREPAPCREDGMSFRLHRKASFSAWSGRTLESYLRDLKEAEQQDKNLMTLKYARMEDLIPPVNENPIISDIVSIQLKWQREVFEKYPLFMAGARPVNDDESSDTDELTSFQNYLRGELETYSDKTLNSLYEDIRGYKEKSENMSEVIYNRLAKFLS